MRRKTVQRLALAALLLLALVLRVWQLEDVPAGLYCDEAGNGYNAYALATAGIDENGTRWPLYVWSFGTSYKNPVFIYAAMLPVKLLGLSAFSVRLTAALFGVATVWAVFALGRALFGPWVGFWAALFLALAPWHLHFSRIAFELIAFPFLFTTACLLLVRFTQGRRSLPAALGLCAACIYAYAPAALFVPAFLVGFGLLFLPELLRHWRQFALALVVTGAVLAPAAVFFTGQTRTGTQYFRRTTFLDAEQPWRPQLERFAHNYAQFFSPRFLMEAGDPIFRHGVRDFGVLHTLYVPLALLGAGTALLRRDRASKLLLWWAALYPVAPSLMNEIPSATRGIIGAPIFCLLAGTGAGALLRSVRVLVPRRRWALALQGAAAAAGLGLLGVESARYLHAYFVDYPTYAALTPGAFQFGYRDAIAYMESRRGDYDVLLLSATDSNQPQVFTQFYRPIDPRAWAARRQSGYLIIRPEDFTGPRPGQRVLAALHPDDVDLFSTLEVQRLITAPGDKLAFVIAELGPRKRFLTDWLILGPFPESEGRAATPAVDPAQPRQGSYRGAFGPVRWEPLRHDRVRVDLNRALAGSDPRHPGNPEHLCAYAVTTLRVPEARAAVLELTGSLNDRFRLWLNGRSLTPFPLMAGRDPQQRDITLRAGDNGLVVQTCEDIGTWDFSLRVLDAQGRDMDDITAHAALPTADAEMEVEAPPQLVEGFAAPVSGQLEPSYPDYRGGTRSWRARVEQRSAVAWRTAAPVAPGPAVFAFTGSTSDEEGAFRLSIDGRPALTFRSHRDRELHAWSGDGATLVFIPKASAAGNSGIYLLSVPAERITPGQPLELRVEGVADDPHAWFMIKNYRDTIAVERLSPELAAEATRGPWRTRPLQYATGQ